MGVERLSLLSVSNVAGHEGPSSGLWSPVLLLGSEGRFLLSRWLGKETGV